MNTIEHCLTLYWCFPSLMNLHGERGSVMALERWASHLGVELRVKRIDEPHELPSLEDADLLFFGPCEIREARILAHRLKNRAQEFREVCAAGVPLLAVGAAGALFARHTQCVAIEESFEGLGLFPMICKERETVFGDDIWADVVTSSTQQESVELLGCQIQTMDTYLDDTADAFACVLYGRGNNGGTDEGCHVNNAIFTNILGPVLVKNPRYALSFLIDAVHAQAHRRGMQDVHFTSIANDCFTYEDASADLIRNYIQAKINKK